MNVVQLASCSRNRQYPRALFQSAQQGSWLSAANFSYLYQEAAGVNPVSAIAQFCGLQLDPSLDLVLGTERVTNGTFDVNTSGWTAAGGTLSVGAEGLIITSTGAGYNARAMQAITTVVGTTYKVSYQIGSLYATGMRVGTSAGASDIYTTSGQTANSTFVFYFRATTTTTHLSMLGQITGGLLASVDNISVKEVKGNHAYQSTSGSRPTVQYGYLSFDKTDDHLLVTQGGGATTGFLLAAGIVVPAAGVARSLWSDTGTNTGYKVGITSSNELYIKCGNGSSFTTLTGPVLVAGTKYAILAWHDGTNLNLTVNNVASTPVAHGIVTAGTTSFTIGKENAVASEYWGDCIYNLLYRHDDNSTPDQRAQLYRYIVSNMGGL